MPNCFTLTPKADPSAGPECLATIDEKLCAYLGVPVDPKYYAHGWYDIIGLLLAIGKPWDDIRSSLSDAPTLLQITDWLEANYIPACWAERR